MISQQAAAPFACRSGTLCKQQPMLPLQTKVRHNFRQRAPPHVQLTKARCLGQTAELASPVQILFQQIRIFTDKESHMRKLTFPPADQALPLKTFTPPMACNGQSLEGIVDGPRLAGSLFDSSELSLAQPPMPKTTDYKRYERWLEQFEEWKLHAEKCEAPAIMFLVTRLLYPLHNLPFRDFSRRKSLPKYVPNDRQDPTALCVTGILILHESLPVWQKGELLLQLDRFLYVYDRLREAELVQVSRNDIRFMMLKALAAFVEAVIAKAGEPSWACEEVV